MNCFTSVELCPRRISRWWVLLLALMAVQVQAERADSSQPLQFDAGQLRIDGSGG